MNLSVFYCKTNEMSSPDAKFFCMPQNDTMEICPTRILYAKGGGDVTVYADILFIVNLYVDALLLSAVRRFLRLPLKTGRWLLAAALGGFSGSPRCCRTSAAFRFCCSAFCRRCCSRPRPSPRSRRRRF